MDALRKGVCGRVVERVGRTCGRVGAMTGRMIEDASQVLLADGLCGWVCETRWVCGAGALIIIT